MEAEEKGEGEGRRESGVGRSKPRGSLVDGDCGGGLTPGSGLPCGMLVVVVPDQLERRERERGRGRRE